jgi:hypothetical protein
MESIPKRTAGGAFIAPPAESQIYRTQVSLRVPSRLAEPCAVLLECVCRVRSKKRGEPVSAFPCTYRCFSIPLRGDLQAVLRYGLFGVSQSWSRWAWMMFRSTTVTPPLVLKSFQ